MAIVRSFSFSEQEGFKHYLESAERIAKKDGISLSQFVGRAIKEYVDRRIVLIQQTIETEAQEQIQKALPEKDSKVVETDNEYIQWCRQRAKS